MLFENHYASRAEEFHWDADRYHRLCAALQLTVHELGAMIRLRTYEVSRFLKHNSFPPVVELQLTFLERAIFPSTRPAILPDPCSSISTS